MSGSQLLFTSLPGMGLERANLYKSPEKEGGSNKGDYALNSYEKANLVDTVEKEILLDICSDCLIVHSYCLA